MTHHRQLRARSKEAQKSAEDDRAQTFATSGAGRPEELLVPSSMLALQRTVENAAIARSLQTQSRQNRLTKALIQRHIVGDAFQAGARVVMAGESHGALNKDEEAAVWRTKNVTVRWESDLFPVGGATGAIRFDSPFIHIVAAIRDVTDLLNPNNLQEWLSDRDTNDQKKLLEEVEIYRDVVAQDLLGQLKEEAQNSPESRPKLTRAELLSAYLKSIAADMRKWFTLTGFQRQLDRHTTRALSTNVQLLTIEITNATKMEHPDVNDPRLGRSASMVRRLAKFAPTLAGMTIWKAGEQHVIDAEALMAGQPLNGAVVLHEAQYLPAFKEELAPIRQRETQAFFQTTPIIPALEHKHGKGWLT